MKFPPSLVHTCITTAEGPVWLAATPQGLAGLWFEGQKHFPQQLAHAPAGQRADDHPTLRQAAQQFQEYLAGQRRAFDLALDLSGGSPFQQSVWHALQALPFGTITSYGALSAKLGNPKAVRAVAAAVGRNPVSVVVPCHRVLGARGDLTGYAGGLKRKAALLTLEGALPASTARTVR